MAIAYLSLGSNVGDRLEHLRNATAGLSAIGKVRRVSSIYETEPVDFTEQPWFLNCAAELETSMTPQQLMAGIIAIETRMGRRRTAKKGPRLIDIDILLFDDAVIEEPGLSIPHPAMHGRRFVLAPVAEIAPKAVHPTLKRTVRELRDALPAGQVVRKIKL